MHVTAPGLAVYVHFPFCLSICPYCDFDRQATGFDRIDAYLDAVEREISRYEGLGRSAHSVFFGGGTPSLMRPEQVASLLRAVERVFPLQPGAEVTLEANPGDANLDKLRGFASAGVNRLSFGVQTLDPAYLPVLGRRHTADEARQAARWARQAGLRFNLDFMYGLPEQSVAHWSGTLDAAVALDPDHLSCYLLTLDGKVPMGRDVERGVLVLPTDDVLGEMYDLARAKLAAAGYEQYEISNWARPGQQSQHNLTYWRDGEWVGLGAGAASSFNGRRWKNAPVVERYIAALRASRVVSKMATHVACVAADEPAPCVEDERPDLATRAYDFLTLGLRLREGIDTARFQRTFGAPLADVLGEEGAWLLAEGYLETNGGAVRVAARHQLITNELLARLAVPLQDWASRGASKTLATTAA